MPRLASAYRGPALVIGVGGGFALVGVIPVAITVGLGLRTSATIIGVGFIGFGVILILPGFCWCLAIQRRRIGLWCGRRNATEDEHLQSTQTISKTPSVGKDDGTMDSLMTPVHDRSNSPQRLLQVDGSKNEWMDGWNEECVQMEGQNVFG